MATASTCFIRGPAAGYPHTHSVIFLHGNNIEASEFAVELFESEAPGPEDRDRTLPGLLPSVRWVFPRARVIQSHSFGDPQSSFMAMWSVEKPEERPRNVSALSSLVAEERALVSPERVFLAGISQGGFATAVAMFMANGQGFAGLMGFCGWRPEAVVVEGIKWAAPPGMATAFRDLCEGMGSKQPQRYKQSLLVAHCRVDDVVPLANGKRMKAQVKALALKVNWHEYSEGGEWLNEPAGIDDMANFIRSNMK
ncbi:phospholipase/Carboxylesterase [Xylariaceae sp. FL0804]|nr:phospholipase/Carboxylesterase [Xylariaceae sp. FL0804]